jgi:hypothetical protein
MVLGLGDSSQLYRWLDSAYISKYMDKIGKNKNFLPTDALANATKNKLCLGLGIILSPALAGRLACIGITSKGKIWHGNPS